MRISPGAGTCLDSKYSHRTELLAGDLRVKFRARRLLDHAVALDRWLDDQIDGAE